MSNIEQTMKTRLLSCFLLAVLSACSKDSESPTPAPDTGVTPSSILSAFTTNVARPNYNDLATRTTTLRAAVDAFISTLGDAELATCKQAWRDARLSWEMSEGMLFGPVSTENIDPRIDTWPVNFVDLEAQLSSGNAFTAAYVNGLEDALKGFHPIEYLLFGQNGNKTAAQMTVREREYLSALCANLETLTGDLAHSWDPAHDNDYGTTFSTAGNGNGTYPTQRAAFEELVNAMAGICDEVANGKMNEPLVAQDPMLEESPFAKNSITDFTNNIKGVENVYLGRYSSNGTGLEDFVRQYDLQLDGTLKQRIAAAVAALGTITVPFGQAIIDQPVQVQQAIDAINALAETINNELLPLVQQHTN